MSLMTHEASQFVIGNFVYGPLNSFVWNIPLNDIIILRFQYVSEGVTDSSGVTLTMTHER